MMPPPVSALERSCDTLMQRHFPLLLVAILFTCGGCGPAGAPPVRLDVPKETITLFQMTSSGSALDATLAGLGQGGHLSFADFAALGQRADVSVQRLVDAHITAGHFDVDTTAEVRYDTLAPDGSVGSAVAPRRSGCRLSGTVSDPGTDGERVISGNLSIAIVKPRSGERLGAPPNMDTRNMQVTMHVSAGAPVVLGWGSSSETTSGVHGPTTRTVAEMLVLIVGTSAASP